ncbi:MAG: PhnD/SsuA/transferrin family substrate-binding protein [Burkholderiaceae bacterium]
MGDWLANARLYALNAQAAGSWRTLFAAVGERADIALEWVEHPAPRSLFELWQRTDLGCAFVCGYPWVSWSGADRPVALAAPRPSNPRSEGRAVYWSDIVVRADAPFERLDDLFGRRMAWTVSDSQSGYQALRTLLAERSCGRPLFSATVGPLVTPRRVVEAVLAGEADAGPLDSYWHDLLRRHEGALAARLRVVARTPPTPMPLLACAGTMPADARERLIDALVEVSARDDLAALREHLQIEGFARVDGAAYELLAQRAAQADRTGYTCLA